MAKKIAFILLAVEIISIITILILYAAFNPNDNFIFWYCFTVFLFVPIGLILYYFLYKKVINLAKNHILVYASRSKKLLYQTNISTSLFSLGEINTNPIEEVEEEYVDKVKAISKEAKEIVIGIIVSIIIIGLEIWSRMGGFSFILIELIACVIAFFYLFYFIIFVIDILTKKYEKVYFNKEKIQAIKDFDEEDESIQITDYKIYEKEMYIQVPAKTKTIYALITKNKLYVVLLYNDLIKLRDDIDIDDYKAYKKFLKKMEVKKHNIRKKDIVEVLKIVREYLYK